MYLTQPFSIHAVKVIRVRNSNLKGESDRVLRAIELCSRLCCLAFIPWFGWSLCYRIKQTPFIDLTRSL